MRNFFTVHNSTVLKCHPMNILISFESGLPNNLNANQRNHHKTLKVLQILNTIQNKILKHSSAGNVIKQNYGRNLIHNYYVFIIIAL